MLKLILILGGILLFAIIVAILRVSSLVNVFRGTDKKVDTASNKWNAALLLIFVIASGIATIYYSVAWFDDYNLPLASEHGAVTDELFWITMAVTGVVFVITQVLLFYFSYRYQYKETNKATFFPHNDRLEIIWTVVPAIALTVLVISGLQAWNNITNEAPQDAEVVEIMGMQFAWSTRYPGVDNRLGDYDYRNIDAVNAFGVDFSDRNAHDDFTPREMHIPKGHPVLLKIRARDVLHSVFAPHFRLKMDAVPGMPTKFWFVATKTTEEMRAETGNPEFNYEIACTEICGRGHFSMRLLVVVDEPEEYEKWKAEQQSWLSKNPEYLAKVPENMRELAMINAGISK
jgi:cytochrome c oxidase subunit 2